MGCRSDYLEPNAREVELRRAARLLVFVHEKTGTTPPEWAVKEAANVYASDERSVTELCAVLRAMPAAKRDKLVYNGRDAQARDLADWWDAHQAADAAREAAERAQASRARAETRARAKLKAAGLSASEMAALGIKA